MSFSISILQVDLLSRLHSPYLVELLGYCADRNHRLLVFEFMPNGTLQHHLHHKQYRPLDWGTRLRIALDCARALEFLHELTIPAVIHRDFKCSNILLDQNFRAKVSDFGSAKTGSERINARNSTCLPSTTGYLAPEWVIHHLSCISFLMSKPYQCKVNCHINADHFLPYLGILQQVSSPQNQMYTAMELFFYSS